MDSQAVEAAKPNQLRVYPRVWQRDGVMLALRNGLKTLDFPPGSKKQKL